MRSKSQNELYLSFSVIGDQIRILLSQKGGVDIEDTFTKTPDAIVSASIDVLTGLHAWQAIDLWHQAGLRGALLRPLGDITAELFAAFRAADAHTLEINPLAVDLSQQLSLVGAMMAVDEYALFRHPEWNDSRACRQHAACG